MTTLLRVIDSGLRTARENLSLTEALCRGRREGTTPDTLRFQHFPRSAIIGRHQLLDREVNLSWCAANGVATARRMTGGGAIVMGPGLLGWELIVVRSIVPDKLAAVSAAICTGVADGLTKLGLQAAYRPRNDIEVQGRKISGTGGYFDGPALVFQGTVLIDLDLAFMTSALNLPAHKLGKRGLSAFAERVGDLKGFLGATPAARRVEDVLVEGLAEALDLAPVWGELSPQEEADARAVHDAEIGTDAFVEGRDDTLAAPGRLVTHSVQTQGGMVEVALKLRDGATPIVDQVLISGDFFAAPPRIVADLEAHLRQLHVRRLKEMTRKFLDAGEARFLGMERADFVEIVAEAARKTWREPAETA